MTVSSCGENILDLFSEQLSSIQYSILIIIILYFRSPELIHLVGGSLYSD